MKTAELGDNLLWKGEPAKIVGIMEGKVALIQEDYPCCLECGRESIAYVLVSSPLYQENAEPIKTIST